MLATCVLLAATATPPQPLTVEAIFGGEGLETALPADVRWMPDGKRLLVRGADGDRTLLWLEDALTGQRRTVADWTELQESLKAQRPDRAEGRLGDVNAGNAARSRSVVAPDGSALVGLAAGDLYLLDLETGEARFLTDDPEPELYPAFSPDGTRLAWVRDGDLYWQALATGAVHRLTVRGDDDHLLHGQAPWVLEEELGVEQSFWWSPDGDRLLLLRYDVSPVDVVAIENHLPTIPVVEQQRYPKAGRPNPVTRLGVVALDGAPPAYFDLDLEPGGSLPRAGWTPAGRIWVQRLDRAQTSLELLELDPASGRVRPLVEERDPAWVNLGGDPLFLDDGRFLWRSERTGWWHLELRQADGTLERRLTEGPWEVTAVAGLLAGRDRVLVQTTRHGVRERHLEVVPIDGGEIRRSSGVAGTHEALLAPAGDLWLQTHSSRERPPRKIVHRADGTEVRLLADGRPPELDRFRRSPVEMGTVSAPDGTVLHHATVRPPDFDPGRRYPVLLYVYGGPHSQLVVDEWGGTIELFAQLLAQQGIVVRWVDNRGTAGRGRDFERAIHRRLGQVELADQLAGLEPLLAEPWADRERVAIYGGSYGGFMALMGLLDAPDVFSAGIAYAPVTDWRLYDTAYTERYMQTPEANPDGYAAADRVARASGLEGALLLVHGTMDNNVHLHHTLRLVEALALDAHPFELMLYPEVRHPVRRSRYKHHFHQLKLDFLRRHLLTGTATGPSQDPPGDPGANGLR